MPPRMIAGVLVTIFCSLIGCASDSTHQGKNYPNDRQSMSFALALEIKPGDSLERVQEILGPGTIQVGSDQSRCVSAVQAWQRDEPALYPSGAKSTDMFVIWNAPGCDQMLQFRNGRLINHSPDSYLASAGLPSPTSEVDGPRIECD